MHGGRMIENIKRRMAWLYEKRKNSGLVNRVNTDHQMEILQIVLVGLEWDEAEEARCNKIIEIQNQGEE